MRFVAKQYLDETVATKLESYLNSHCDPDSPKLEGELISVETKDRLQLYGMLCSKGKKWCSTTPEDYLHKLQIIGVITRLVISDHNLAAINT